MPHTFARAVLTSAIAFGTLVFSAGSAAPAEYTQNQYSSINPYAGPVGPVAPAVVPAVAHNGRTVIVVQQPPQLLTPADLYFSVEKEGDVTVVRGPIAH
ncbi:MAG TPA: hypothetical protein VEU53_08700 [Stellaceae bacterium]|nr:hypothetical protein [Stellaceae bacterium]